MLMMYSKKLLKNLRWTSIVLAVSNLAVVVMGVVLLESGFGSCMVGHLFPLLLVVGASALRIIAMVRCAIEQQSAAVAILGSSVNVSIVGDDEVSLRHRRIRFKRWLWWTRFATIVTVLQFVLAVYHIFAVGKHISQNGSANACTMGSSPSSGSWKGHLLLYFIMLLCFIALLQCFAGSDVLRWRSFYDTHNDAWKAHYQEVFDNGIREALCCMGRAKYLSAMEEDEIYSVAQLLGDLVTYRASGTGHLELLAGLALLQKHKQPLKLEGSVDAPQEKIQEATSFLPFAEAAYTGPLLDVGRNPILFPCVWLYRQGILTAWSRNRRPVLQGDNWWRGHAAAFLKYLNLPADALLHGRVNQAKCEAAYFVVVLHHQNCVVISVRGTETPEDLITDGLCRETPLTMEDLDGLINCCHIDPMIRESVLSSFPHYGHAGIVEAARELFRQIEGSNATGGFLSSLLGAGGKYEGYAVRIVGHSLGGAIASLLGVRLYSRYPNLRVYAYGPLPCVDFIIADACSCFVTCIVHDSEFSAFLSVNSILRLRASALTTLSQGTAADTAMIYRLAQLFLRISNYQSRVEHALPASESSGFGTGGQTNHVCESRYHIHNEENNALNQDFSWEDVLVEESSQPNATSSSVHSVSNTSTADETVVDNPFSQFMEAVPSLEIQSADDPPEMFLPGLVIHLLRQQQRRIFMPLWKGWRDTEWAPRYKAVIANRENFKDILVSPYMFLDHLPWRCQYALQQVIKFRNSEAHTHEEPQTM